MQRIIKNNQVIDETWHLLPKETTRTGKTCSRWRRLR